MVRYKKKCNGCRKVYVEVAGRQGYTLCYDCQKSELDVPIKDPKMKKLFKIPEEFYKQNTFLRNIKSSYIRFENLTEKQEAAFKKVVAELKERKKALAE